MRSGRLERRRRLRGGRAVTVPWLLDVYRRSDGGHVYGVTFTAPADADPRELADGACRHAAAEYGGSPEDYISTRPLCMPDFDSDPGAETPAGQHGSRSG